MISPSDTPVREAAESGGVDPDRLTSYRYIFEEVRVPFCPSIDAADGELRQSSREVSARRSEGGRS